MLLFPKSFPLGSWRGVEAERLSDPSPFILRSYLTSLRWDHRWGECSDTAVVDGDQVPGCGALELAFTFENAVTKLWA